MGYRITAFGTASLPSRHEMQDATTGEISDTLVRLPGGAFDAAGAAIAGEPAGYQVRVSGIVTGATPAELKTNVYALRSLRGKYDQLYRTPDGGSANSEHVWARCLAVYSERDWTRRLHEDVAFDFAVESPYWFGSVITQSGTLDANPTSFFINNTGNVDATVGTLTVVAGTADLTSVILQNYAANYESQVTYSGTVPASGTLIFDLAARSVMNNGTEDYGTRLTLGALHKISDWCRLFKDTNELYIWSSAGAGTPATYAFTFWESLA